MDPSFVLGEPKTTFPNVIIDPEVVIIADSFQNLADRLHKMLNRLITRLKNPGG